MPRTNRKKTRAGRKPPVRRATAKTRVAPRSAAEYLVKPPAFQDEWRRAVGIVSRMRTENVSLKKASEDADITPRRVLRLAGSGLKKQSNGRYTARKSDDLLRVLNMAGTDGVREVAVRGSKRASLVAKYSAAVDRYIQTGDETRLKAFIGKSVKSAEGVEISFLTDTTELKRLGYAGALSFHQLYRGGR